MGKICAHAGRHNLLHRHRYPYLHRDGLRLTQKHVHTDRHTDTGTGRQADRQTDTNTHTHTHSHTHTHTHMCARALII